MKTVLRQKLILKNPEIYFLKNKTDFNRLEFIIHINKYTRANYIARQHFRHNEGTRISNLAKSKPKQFWKNIKKNYKTTQPNADKLNLLDLFDHFKSLYDTTDTTINDDNNNHMNNLSIEV